LAFGITTGLGAEAGLITAIVAGLVATVFGGSNVQVSGPTGAMTVVLVPLVHRYGVDAVYLVGLMAGVIVLVAAFARVGRYLAYIPWPVIEGFTVGIAIIIFLQQVPSALGVAKPDGENTAVVAAKAVRDAFGDGMLSALGLVVLVAAVMIVVPRLHRALPASLLAVTIATVVAQVADLSVSRIGKLPGSFLGDRPSARRVLRRAARGEDPARRARRRVDGDRGPDGRDTQRSHRVALHPVRRAGTRPHCGSDGDLRSDPRWKSVWRLRRSWHRVRSRARRPRWPNRSPPLATV